MSLSFDEFRAVSKRNKREKEGEEDEDEQAGPGYDEDKHLSRAGEDEGDDAGISRSSKDKDKAPFTLGDFLEMQEIQALTLVFLCLDTFAAFAQLSLANNTNEYSKANVFALLVKIMQSLSTFFVFFFAFEIISLLIAFRLRIFGHLGYVVDLGVIGLQAWAVATGTLAVECHILNIFRLWRLVRLFQSMVSVEVEAHSEARSALQLAVAKKQQLRADVQQLSSDLKKEQEARGAVEAMLQEYKDEVDTLNEALKIAALDIAEVAQAEDDFFLSDDEGEEDDVLSTDLSASLLSGEARRGALTNDDAGSSVSFASSDAASSPSGALQKKEALYKQALHDSKGAVKPQRSTIVINENGSFQQS